MSTEPMAPLALIDAYTAKINEALSAGQENLAAELANEYLDEIAQSPASAA
jgi:hypothetical protein